MVLTHPRQAVIPLFLIIAFSLTVFSFSISDNTRKIILVTTSPQSIEKQEMESIHKYPKAISRWNSMIKKNAVRYNLNADLIAAVIWQESGGDPNAYSSSGAVGLMQVMPRDGLAAAFLCTSEPCFKDRPKTAELWAPEFNVEYGSRLLSGYINKYGSTREGLRHYGPMDVGYYYADIVISLMEKLK
jgi:soluble lytic murein transglycosylase-like protein